MGWKNWSYWLKWGLAVTIITGILNFIAIFFIYKVNLVEYPILGLLEIFEWPTTITMIIPGIIGIILLIIVGGTKSTWFRSVSGFPNPELKAEILMFIVSIFVYFVIGALIGFIYGKIKNNKSK